MVGVTGSIPVAPTIKYLISLRISICGEPIRQRARRWVAKNLPPEGFVWEGFDTLIKEGRFRAPIEVHNELKKKDDELSAC
jgi:hypothetical protein